MTITRIDDILEAAVVPNKIALRDWLRGQSVLSVQEAGAVGDDTTSDAGAIQEAIDYVETAGGGVVWMPRGQYFTSTTALTIQADAVQLWGEGGDYDESSGTDAPTLIRYTGLVDAITIGTPSMTAVLHGLVIRDLEIKGTGDAVGAGIHFEYNGAGFFTGRSLVDNVSVKGFVNAGGAGIQVDFGVSLTFRRTNTSQNLSGIKIDGGTALHLNGIIARSNTSNGVHVRFANGLLLDGMSVIESNAYQGLFLEGVDNSRNIYLRNLHFEENNITGGDYQLYMTGSGAVRAKNVVIHECEFSSNPATYPAQIGDMFVDFIEYADIRHIWSNRATGATLKIGTTRSNVRYGPQFVTAGGTVDPDTRGIAY